MYKLHFAGRFLQQLEAFKRGDAVAALAGPESMDVGFAIQQASQEQDVLSKLGLNGRQAPPLLCLMLVAAIHPNG